MAIFCPASWLPLYHLASTWLQLPPITLFYLAIPNKLHFTPMTMEAGLYTRVPCSTFALI